MATPSSEPAGLPSARIQLPVQGQLPSFSGATEWLNTPPLTATGLRGKVVLVNFWTYTCINWLRQLPYLRAWSAAYADDGLVVVGVHTPEFGFEADVDNVRRAVRELEIDYPVAIDSNYTVWTEFGNHYWPALYFADADGLVRHHHFGEGEYHQSEQVIRQLLGSPTGQPAQQAVEGKGIEAAANWSSLRSPETYTGYERTQNFASPGGVRLGRQFSYDVPTTLRLNQWALGGEWAITEQASISRAPNTRIAFRFHARDLHLVMGPRTPGASVAFQVRIDGESPGAAAGVDIDGRGDGMLTHQRLYQLVRQPGPISDRTFEVIFHHAGAHAYAFTFG